MSGMSKVGAVVSQQEGRRFKTQLGYFGVEFSPVCGFFMSVAVIFYICLKATEKSGYKANKSTVSIKKTSSRHRK